MKITSIQAVDNDTWDAKIVEIVNRNPASNLLSIPGVYELIKEELNNQVITELMDELGLEE